MNLQHTDDSSHLAYFHDVDPADAARYGQLAIVAIDFHVIKGTPVELDAAYWYTRYAVRAAAVQLDSTEDR